jgi:8-oxo-dGTP pyrophosphatase MutT (NUDIX family)
MNRELPDLLARRLAEPLPGLDTSSRFESRPHLGGHSAEAPPGARHAAVLLLLYPWNDRWYVPLTLRPAHLPDHAHQVCLPGGAVEPGEASDRAAVREFHEELGAEGSEVRMLGRLSPIYVRASNFRVDPWVACTDRRPAWAPNMHEVEQLLEVPLDHLLDPTNLGCRERHYDGQAYTAPHFTWEAEQIWGATCRMLGEFVTLLETLRVAV